ncbi:MAG: methyltransferase domain-containing protein [Pseudonocardiaceae bacterium]
MTGWRSLLAAMTEQLVSEGTLTDPAWRRAFAETPRHVFVPDWSLEDAYSQESLVTQWRTADSMGNKRPTSAASAPAAVAAMLDRLAVHDGHRVLEIGTGTGYNAALLCHRLGSANVCSIDIDRALVDNARLALKSLGCDATLAAGDGYGGLLEGAPYDRILATCAVTHVPPEWIRQLTDGGRIVAPIAGNSCKPLLVLDKTAPNEVTGRFDHRRVGFMPLRPSIEDPLGPGETTGLCVTGMAHEGTTRTDPGRIHDATSDLVLFCQFHLPGLQHSYDTGSDDLDRSRVKRLIVHTADAMAGVSFTRGDDGRWPVVQRGRHRIWDTIESALELWDYLREPDISRFGVSALDDVNRQYVWLDDPEGPYSWPMPL